MWEVLCSIAVFHQLQPENSDFTLTKNGSLSVSVEGVADDVEMLIIE